MDTPIPTAHIGVLKEYLNEPCEAGGDLRVLSVIDRGWLWRRRRDVVGCDVGISARMHVCVLEGGRPSDGVLYCTDACAAVVRVHVLLL